MSQPVLIPLDSFGCMDKVGYRASLSDAERVILTLACSDINGPTDCFALGSSRTRTKHGTSA